MKKSAKGVLRLNRSSMAFSQFRIAPSKLLFFCSLVFVFAFVFSGCKKETGEVLVEAAPERLAKTGLTDPNVINDYQGLSQQLKWELQQARAATARYRNIDNALRDGYADINVVAENMGYHFMREVIVDEVFEISRPEILVYNKDHDGNFHLVAVEYAVPLTNPVPEGFTGSMDEWDGNTGFPFWLLHAWVWNFNPSGVFNPTNPLVHLH